MLTVDKLCFEWRGKPALDGVSFTLAQGQVMALLGPNGAGKTTLLRCILGQLQPSSGQIRAEPDSGYSDADDSPLVSWVPQRVTLYPQLSVAQNLAGFARIMGVHRRELASRVSEVLELIGLAHRADDVAKNLSGGMQRMLNVGIGLVSNPRFLLIDEPTAGIDKSAYERLYTVLERLRDQGLGILMTTHDLDDVSRLASRAVILVKGSMRAEGSVDELILQRFSGLREVRLQLQQGSAGLAEVENELSGMGLSSQGDGLWAGLVERNSGEFQRLSSQLLSNGDLIGEFSMQKPGLDLFIQSLLEDTGSRP